MNEREIIQLILETVRGHLVYDGNLDMWIIDNDFMLALNVKEYNLLDDICTRNLVLEGGGCNGLY